MEVAAGDDSTLTCTATGYPEATISFQISGLSANLTEGNQSTVTIATPTVPFIVSRSITVSNVTIADCDAVITCTAENTNRDGIQNTSGSVTIQVLGKKLIYVCHTVSCKAASTGPYHNETRTWEDGLLL